MKKLLKKMFKKNKPESVIYIIVGILYLIELTLFIKNLVSLSGIETLVRALLIILFVLFFGVYIYFGYKNILKKKHKLFVLKTILALLSIFVFATSSIIIDYFIGSIGALVEKDKIEYSTYLIALKDTKFDSNSKIGLIDESTDDIVNTLAKKIIEDHNLTNKTDNYDDYLGMLNDLYDGKVDAIFVQGNYVSLYETEEKFANITQETKIIYKTSAVMGNEDASLISGKDFSDPITILIMGVDSTTDGLNANAAFNGDTLMLITFNPHNYNATMFSIPRDTYVPIACKSNAKAKINSAAAYGTSCVINTIKNLTSIDIDYYVKINFKGVVDLVNALGGIEVDVQAPDIKTYGNQVCEQNSDREFDDQIVCMDPGKQTLNGEQALAYSRCRHLYLISDLARIKHQQDVVTAIGQKVVKVRNYSEFKNVIDAIIKNISTNMSTSQMLSGYQVLKNMVQNALDGEEFLTINKSYLEVYNLSVFLSSSNMYTSALGYYPASLNAIVDAMKVNLELKQPEMIKTFEFSVNEEYVIKSAGEGIRGGSTETTLPNFVKSSVSYTESWCSKNGISCDFKYVDESSEYYNNSIDDGLIVNQTIHDGELLSNISSITFYVNKKKEVHVKDAIDNTNTNTEIETNEEENKLDDTILNP